MKRNFDERVHSILLRHPEYHAEIYDFVRQGVEVSIEHFHKEGSAPHLTAPEVYFGVCAHALEEYGPLAGAVFAHWGVRHARDIGTVAYYLIEAGYFAKSRGDALEQFDTLQPLEAMLEVPYLPALDMDFCDPDDMEGF